MKKFVIQTVLLILVTGAALFIFFKGSSFSGLPFAPQQPVFRVVEIKGFQFTVEMADTQDKRSKGLAGRTSLAQTEGMLFIFPKEGKYPFWMKGLTIPLDFIWIRGDKVVDISPNVDPPFPGQPEAFLTIYEPKENVDKVLEVQAGTIERLGIKPGDAVVIK